MVQRADWARAGALTVLTCLLPTGAWAVTTLAFEVEGVKAFKKGTFEGTAALSDGRLVRGVRTEARPLEGVPVAYSSAADEKGRVFVGTGNKGAVYKLEAGKLAPFATVDTAVVTALVAAEGALYVGGMPAKGVQKIDSKGRVQAFAELPGAEQVWALVYDAQRKLLYAGTGPQGQIFRIDSQGKASTLYDAEAEHVLSLALDPSGTLYAGTDKGARLYRLSAGKAEVVYDFPGDELGAIDVHEGRIAVVANKFAALPTAKSNGGPSKAPKLKPGKGEAWVVHPDGRAEVLYKQDDSHFTDVELDGSDAMWVALGAKGRVLRVELDGTDGLWTEVEAGQVMALGLGSPTPHVLGSDSAALYLVGETARAGVWTSDPLDATTRARFGELLARSTGDAQWQTRSGNVDPADDTWSAWSRPTRGAGPVRSPAARYLQVRVNLNGPDAELRSLEAFYLPANRPARSRNIHFAAPAKKKETHVDGVLRVPSKRKLSWDTDNPDDDTLSYRLHFQRDGTRPWLPILGEKETLEASSYEWETESLPDGLYRIRVTTSDAPSNPSPYTLSSETISPLLRVDNHAPTVEIKFTGSKIQGRASDGTSRIAALTASVDGRPRWPIAPNDDLLDRSTEQFSFSLPQLPTGAHIVTVRATDAVGNSRIEQMQVEVK